MHYAFAHFSACFCACVPAYSIAGFNCLYSDSWRWMDYLSWRLWFQHVSVLLLAAPFRQACSSSYISDICIARHVTAHVTPSRDGSSFQGMLLLLFGRSSLPACSRGRGAQKESRWEWQRRGCVQHAEGATLQDGARDLIRRQRGKDRPY